MAVRSARMVAGVLVGVLVACGLVACEPVPPRLVLVVTSEAAGADAEPGDGVCATAEGACTLPAAIEEGNASPSGADITVPTGDHSSVATVTGDLRVNHGVDAEPWIDPPSWTIAAGGHLELTGANTSTSHGDLPRVDAVVEDGGELVAIRTYLGRLSVRTGGTAVLSSSATGGGFLCNGLLVANGGTLVADSSSLLSVDHRCRTPPLVTDEGGRTVVGRTVVASPTILSNGGSPSKSFDATCAGEAPESLGWFVAEVPCGSTPAPGDGSGPAGVFLDATIDPQAGPIGLRLGLLADSPLVDAIPLGTPGCDVTARDLYGNPRGVDGDGDGVGGCDIGAVERQPAPA